MRKKTQTLPVPYTYFDKEGNLQVVCFFIPVPKTEGVNTHGVDVRKLVNMKKE